MALLVSRRGHSFSLSFSLSLTLSFELCMQWLRGLRGVALRTSAVFVHILVLVAVLVWCLGPGGAILEAMPIIDFFLHTLDTCTHNVLHFMQTLLKLLLLKNYSFYKAKF